MTRSLILKVMGKFASRIMSMPVLANFGVIIGDMCMNNSYYQSEFTISADVAIFRKYPRSSEVIEPMMSYNCDMQY